MFEFYASFCMLQDLPTRCTSVVEKMSSLIGTLIVMVPIEMYVVHVAENLFAYQQDQPCSSIDLQGFNHHETKMNQLTIVNINMSARVCSLMVLEVHE